MIVDPEFVGQHVAVPASTGAPATPLLPPQSAVISQPRGIRIAGAPSSYHQRRMLCDRERRGVGADADIDPSGIGGDVVDAIGHRLAEFGDLEVMHPDRLRARPWGRNSRPPFLKSPTSSFFLVSTEITGSPAAWNAFTSALMCSNWALRSGWLAPSRVLLLACRLKPRRRSKRPTSFWPAVKPRSASAADRWRWLLLTHSKGSLGIAADRRLHQLIQGFQKPRLCLDRGLAATTPPANPIAEQHGARTQVRQAATDRAARNSGRPRHRSHPATSGRTRFTGREQATFSLVQERLKRIEAGLDGILVDHRVRLDAKADSRRLFRLRSLRCCGTLRVFYRVACSGSGP